MAGRRQDHDAALAPIQSVAEEGDGLITATDLEGDGLITATDLEGERAPSNAAWLIRTNWDCHLAGCRAASLVENTILPGGDGKEPDLERLCLAVRSVLDRCRTGSQSRSCPYSIRKLLLTSYGEDDVTQGCNVFAVPSDLFAQGSALWTRLFCYLIRAYSKPSATRLTLTPLQTSLLKELDVVIKSDLSDQTEVEQCIMRTSVSIMEQKLNGWTYLNPLVHFAAILAMDQSTLTWAATPIITPIFQHLLHIIRILSLEHCLPIQARDPLSMLVQFRRYRDSYMTPDSDTPGAELADLYRLSVFLSTRKNGGAEPGAGRLRLIPRTLQYERETLPSEPTTPMPQPASTKRKQSTQSPSTAYTSPVASAFPTSAISTSDARACDQLRELVRLFRIDLSPPMCVACYLEVTDEAMNHRFSDCKSASVGLGDMLTFRKHIKFRKLCHYACGMPRFICLLYEGSCEYIDILVPVLLLAYRESTYRHLLRQYLEPHELATEASYGTAVCKPSVLYGVDVPLAVVLFNAIMQVRREEVDAERPFG